MSEPSPKWEPPPAGDSPPAGASDTIEGATGSADVASLTFEQALAALETIVQDLERGQLDLDSAIRAYERGTELKKHCETKLREAQLRVEKISLSEDGQIRSDPTDLS